ncbi:hypothetical protein PUNSTDRAFT_125040 [Punctularia strigosozonata HHB-11173 SS5]|uniref:uncharacterized protein n=1 Tax=Punctularia strigosozonata (strain HHB-11173) TaxID=741275 RepID=UPI0004417D9B|nr:uncharacterized protein PUNSTDRAFT_125040 [Punctularia strigosozonata HHB-11173 SS5]EIN11899.1 hypothetical protein PUNSTDRAFT_125040 [Punctularia strigosozonata HHB-11173 SS5]
MEYTLPRNGSIFFHSNVSEGDEWQQLVKGTLQVGINPDTKIHDTVFSFGLSYANEVSLKQVSVCLVDIGGSRGIRIVMPGDVTQVHPVIFDMKVLLPYHSGSPASFGEFRTYLPLVTQKLGDLDAFARFDRVYLEGPLSPVTVDSIQASKLTIKTSMAEISGSFNVSEFLDLDTTSAAVKANVLLANDRSSDFQRMTRMQISTGNSAIDANVTLLAHGGHTGDFPPDFDVSFATFNGDLSVSLGHHSLSRPSHLKAKMQNNLAPVNVTLDDLYQGTFDSQTKFATAHVLEGSTTLRTPFRVEAAVNGRATRAPRILYEYDHYVTSRIIGWTGWEKRARGRGQGHVEVVSSLSPVTLRLGHHNTT